MSSKNKKNKSPLFAQKTHGMIMTCIQEKFILYSKIMEMVLAYFKILIETLTNT